MRITATIVLCLLALSVWGQSSTQVRILDTMADLMARKPVANETVQVRNKSSTILWSAPRTFTAYSTSAVTNAHDGTHYVTNGLAGSIYASADRNAVSQMAEWFGAGGNDAVDDSAPIQAAVDWLAGRTETWSGVTNAVTGEVVMPAGNLVFASAVLVDGPFGIRGAGRESTVITCTGTNDGFNVTIPYFAGQYSFAYLHDFSLYKTLNNRTGNGIHQGATGSQIIAERINITGFENGLKVQGWGSSFRDITIQETGANSVLVPSSVTFGYNPTSTQFERVLAKNGVGNGFNIENSSYFGFFSCYSEKHTNGIGWRIVTTSDRGVAGNNYAIQMENCASEFDLVALEASRASSLRWTGGMFIPRSESTNVVRFIGPVQAKLDGVEVVLSYTPSQAGYTVWTEDDDFGGWPNDIQIVGGQWRRMLSGLENRPGTVKWVDSFTNPSPFRDLPADAPSITSTASSGAVSFDLTGHAISTNAFTLYLDATWPEYNSASTEIVAHTSNSQTIWANTNAMFLAQFNDAKFGVGSYIDSSANSLSLRATNTLFNFSGKRTRILFSRGSDGARLWVDGRRIPFQTTETGSGGSIATNAASGPWLHFGSLLGATRWRYHGGGLLNHAITDDAQAYRITLRGPDAELPWASFGTGTNGVVASWRVTANGDFRDAGPLKIPAYQIGTLKVNGIGDDLWTVYGRREFIATNATASSQFRQTYGTVLPGYAEVFNSYGGLLLVDSTNNDAQKAARLGVPNYQSDTIAPLGLVGGLSYSGGGDVNFGGYGSSLFTKPSQYYWAYASTNSDTTGWLGMSATRANGLHLLNPGVLRIGTNTTSGQHSVLAHVETGRLQLVGPVQIEFYANVSDREVTINTNGLVIEPGKSITLGGVTQTNWPSGGTVAWGDITGKPTFGDLALEDWPPSDDEEYVAKNGAWAIATGGGGGGHIHVDGVKVNNANLADSAELLVTAVSTNVTYSIASASIATNKIDATFHGLLTAPATVVSTNITDSTSAGRTLLTAADAAAQRTALAITNYQGGVGVQLTGTNFSHNIEAGANITLSTNGSAVVITASGGGGGSTNLVSSSASGLAPQATLANAYLGTDSSTNVAWQLGPFIAGGQTIVSNTVTETTIFETTIPSNTLANDGDGLNWVLSGIVLNDSGAGRTIVVKVLIDGVTVYQDTTDSITASSTKRALNISGYLLRSSSTLAQGGAIFSFGAGAATTGVGDIGGAALRGTTFGWEDASATWSSSVTFKVTFTLSAASTSFYTKTSWRISR